MAKIYSSIAELVGRTPLLELKNYGILDAKVLAQALVWEVIAGQRDAQF